MKVEKLMYPICKCRNCGEYVVIKKPIKDTREIAGITKGIRSTEESNVHWCDEPPTVEGFEGARISVILDIIGTIEPKDDNDQNESED